MRSPFRHTSLSWAVVLICLGAPACGQDLSAASWIGYTTESTSPSASSALSSLRVQAPVATLTAGAPVTMTVQALDADGALVPNYAGTLTFYTGDANAVSPPPYTMQPSDHGQHNFTVALKTVGTNWFQVFDAKARVTARLSLMVIPGAPAALRFASYPVRINAGAQGSLTVEAVDTSGNVVPGYAGTVSFSTDCNAATLPAPYTFQASDAGTHTFVSEASFSKETMATIKATASPLVPAEAQIFVAARPVLSEHGGLSMCALNPSTLLECWGDNAMGELGTNDTNSRGAEPNQFSAMHPINLGTNVVCAGMAQGEHHTCALLTNGNVKCWGDNTDGKLGLGLGPTADYGSGPAYPMGNDAPSVDLGTPAEAISLGYWHSCALLNDYSVKCWGWNNYGQLGQGNTNDIGTPAAPINGQLNFPPPLALGGRALALSSGYAHTCALMDSFQVKCWGDNASGQLGLGDTASRGSNANQMGAALPTVNLGTGRSAVAISAQGYGTCALLDDGSLKCWGQNDQGQLGLGDTTNRGVAPGDMGDNLPSVDFGGHTVQKVASGYYHSCALLDDSELRCWGANGTGQLGLGDTTARGSDVSQMGNNLPAVQLGTNDTVSEISLGDNFTCVYLTTNQYKCWGQNPNGQLGYGDTQSRGTHANQMGNNLPVIPIF